MLADLLTVLEYKAKKCGVVICCSRCEDLAGLIQRLHHDVHGRFGEQRPCPKRHAGSAEEVSTVLGHL